MKTGDLTRLFGVSNTTIKNWVDRFPDYFSDAAKAVNQRQRAFTESDILTLATIAQLSQQEHLAYEQIEDRLGAGYRVDDPGIANFGVDTRMVPAAAVEQMIDSTEIRMQLEQVKAERDKLVDMLSESQGRELQLLEKNEQLQREIRELERKLGQAEGELNYRRQLDEKSRRDG